MTCCRGNGTGSIGSLVPPAVTTTVFPASEVPTAAGSLPPRIARARRAISSGAGRRPMPLSPEPSAPDSGSMTWTPRSRSVATFAWVAGASHIFECIAGATTTGAREASTVNDTMSSAKPPARRARVFAVAGTMMIRSATRASSTCSARPSPAISTATGRDVMPSQVDLPTNSNEACVAATYTSWPAR